MTLKLNLDELRKQHLQQMKPVEETAKYEKSSEELVRIALTQIKPNPNQPRLHFNESEIVHLANSIQTLGLLQPISVRPSSVPGEYFIVAGERRYRAFQSLGEQFIDCIIIKVNDAENATLALTENLSREDLIDYEVAKAILVVENKWDNKTMLAEYLGISRSILYRYLSYRKLPSSVLEMLDNNPTLLSAKTSEEVVKVAKDYGLRDDEFADILIPLLQKAQKEQIKQSAIADILKEKLTNPKDVKKDSSSKPEVLKSLKVGNKTVGSIKRKGDKVVVDIPYSLWADNFEGFLLDRFNTLQEEQSDAVE